VTARALEFTTFLLAVIGHAGLAMAAVLAARSRVPARTFAASTRS
jgi:hypothetical protein